MQTGLITLIVETLLHIALLECDKIDLRYSLDNGGVWKPSYRVFLGSKSYDHYMGTLSIMVNGALDWMLEPCTWAKCSVVDYLVDAALYEAELAIEVWGADYMLTSLDNALYLSKMLTGEYRFPFEVFYDDLIDEYDYRFSRLFVEAANLPD
jgi:hypothetical protein